MCGLAGFSGTFDAALLGRMSAAIAHRGPDGEGSFVDAGRGIGLAHRRLAVLDLTPFGNQPMWDRERRACIVFNGEIYNFRALRRELEADGFSFRGQSDTEVLLGLYLRDGRALFKRINGIFAFAIYDAVSGEIIVARDGLGVKPLYYADTPVGFVFASEIKALLQSNAVDRSLDLTALGQHLTYLWCAAPRTLLRAVRKVEPGEAITVSAGRISRRWYHYRLPIGLPGRTPAATWDPAVAIERVRSAVGTAVARQLVSDVPVGAFLSGGLDSSAVVACARAAAPDASLACFTIALDPALERQEGIISDLPYAERVARHLGLALHRIQIGAEVADQLPTMLYHLDEPQADPAALNVLAIARRAREHGIKVLLSGVGGDDIFSGYRRHRALALECYWRWLPARLRRVLAQGAATLPTRPGFLRKLARAGRDLGRDGDDRLAGYFEWQPRGTVQGLLVSDLAVHANPDGALQESLKDLPKRVADLDRMLYLECRHFLADHNLNYTDKMGMAAGVEVRVPLLDPDLVALAFSLAPGLKQHGSTGKWVFKRAMEPLLPRDVIYRRKTGFGVPLRGWLRGPLKTLLHDTLSSDTLRARGLFEPRAVQRLLALDHAGRVDGAYPLFALLCLELWCRIFLDREGLA